MNKLQIFGTKLGNTLSKNSPAILTTAAVGGLIGTAILAVKATPKAMSLLEFEDDRYDYLEGSPRFEQITDAFTKKEIIQICYEPYLPAIAMGVVTIVCIIGANTVNNRRNAALASLYSVADTSLREYRHKVRQKFGDAKATDVRDEIEQDRINKNPPNKEQIVYTGQGDVLCKDSYSGRYFMNNIEHIRRTENDLNKDLWGEDFIALNDYYSRVGLDLLENGEEIGWSLATGMIEFTFSSLLHDGKPVLVINYDIEPYNQA